MALFRRGKGGIDLEEGILCFAGKLKGVKSNTRGFLVQKEGQYVFEYRQRFFFEKSVVLNVDDLYLIESVNYPSLNTKANGWGSTRIVFSPMFQN